MPTATRRPVSDDKGGAARASNETPVSTAEDPTPPPGANTRATRSPELAANQREIDTAGDPDPADKPNGRDHPAESEHDHARQKLKGASPPRPSSPRSTH